MPKFLVDNTVYWSGSYVVEAPTEEAARAFVSHHWDHLAEKDSKDHGSGVENIKELPDDTEVPKWNTCNEDGEPV